MKSLPRPVEEIDAQSPLTFPASHPLTKYVQKKQSTRRSLIHSDSESKVGCILVSLASTTDSYIGIALIKIQQPTNNPITVKI